MFHTINDSYEGEIKKGFYGIETRLSEIYFDLTKTYNRRFSVKHQQL